MAKRKPRTKDFQWTAPEHAAWALPEAMTVSQWADANRVLDSKTSAEPGNWRTDRTPYLREILDSFTDPWTEEITVMASTQVGKTECEYNMLAYVIDQDPGPALLVMPREPDAKTASVNRIKPMIEVSPALARHMPANADDFTAMEMRLDRMTLYLAGANSPAALASKPIRYLFLDEVDKYPPFAGREADPIKLATERIRTYKAQGSARVVKVSTPTTRNGYIFREYEKSDQRRYHVPCPRCGAYHVLAFGNMRWPEDATIDQIAEDRLAWMDCPHCHGRIEDRDKVRMLSLGVWVPEGATINPDGTVTGSPLHSSHRGYWFSALYSPWLTFSDVVVEFLRSKSHPELLMNFVNSWLAEVWEESTHESTPEKLRKEREATYPAGVVPSGVLVLTAGVDVQQDHMYFVIRGWGYSECSWLIRWGMVSTWEELDAVLYGTAYPRMDGGAPMPVSLACIDSGAFTSDVYQFCRSRGERARPIKGQDHLSGMHIKPSKVDSWMINGRSVSIPGGLALYHVDTTYFKDKLSRLMNSPAGNPTQWWIHSEIEDMYLNQVTAEHKVIERNRKTGRATEYWKLKSIGGANHCLDAEVYCLAAAEMLHVWAMRPAEAPVKTYEPPVKQTTTNTGSWMGNRGSGWMGRR